MPYKPRRAIWPLIAMILLIGAVGVLMSHPKVDPTCCEMASTLSR